MGKILEEERKEYWTLRLNKLKNEKLFNDLLTESEQCVSEFSNWHFGYLRSGTAKYGLKNCKSAILDYRKVIKLDPNNTEAHNAIDDHIEAPALSNSIGEDIFYLNLRKTLSISKKSH